MFFLPYMFSSVQSLSGVRLCDSHGLQHARPPCPSPTPGVYPNSIRSEEKETATHSWTEEPGRLQSMGSQELDMIE